MKKKQLDEIKVTHPKIAPWVVKVADVIGMERIEMNDFETSPPEISITPKHSTCDYRLWRSYNTFNVRTYKLAIRDFKTDKEWERKNLSYNRFQILDLTGDN